MLKIFNRYPASNPEESGGRMSLRSTPSKKGEKMPAGKTGTGTGEREDKQLLCFTCRNVLTRESNTIEVSGKHSHFFTNPAGIEFNLRCFSDAPGCEIKGVPIADFTWFPGYHWCFAFCSECSVQSGWFYLSPSDRFFGLIREALI